MTFAILKLMLKYRQLKMESSLATLVRTWDLCSYQLSKILKLILVYDTAITTNVVVLNTIHIDIMDYIIPASCSDAEFRTMWVEFEWENKVAVNTTITDLHEYLRVLLKSTNMKCLTPEKALSGQCGFMAANMYARSIFGEDALANLSIEKPLDNPDAPVTGHIRIRAKSQVSCHLK